MDKGATDTLIAQLYSAASGRQRWEHALNGMSTACDAWAVQLVAVDRRSGSVLFSHYGGEAKPEAHLAYLRTYQYLDPRSPLILAQPPHEWFHCHEAFGEAEVATSPFYQDFLIPVGARYLSAVSLVTDSDIGVILAILRGVGKPPLDAPVLHWLDSLRPHLSEAIAIYRHLSALHAQSIAGQVILDRLTHPVFLVDAARSLRFANAAGQQALESRLAVRRVEGRLQGSDPKDDYLLVEALNALAVAAPRTEGADRRFVRLRGTDWKQRFGMSISTLRPDETSGAFGAMPLAMMVLHNGNLDTHCDPFVIQELFGLTPAEADVGVLLCNGATAETIAAQRGVAVSTIRSQLRTLMQKTGAVRQGDLVRRLLTLPHGFD